MSLGENVNQADDNIDLVINDKYLVQANYLNMSLTVAKAFSRQQSNGMKYQQYLNG
jgi:hypothetical protein